MARRAVRGSSPNRDKVEKVMHEYKHGLLRSYPNKQPVTDRQQAIAIALSEQQRQDNGNRRKP